MYKMGKTRYVSLKKACEILGVHFKTLYNWKAKKIIEISNNIN